MQASQFPQLTEGGVQDFQMNGMSIPRALHPLHINPVFKSKKQVAYLLSGGSPLTKEQQAKLRSELHTGEVKIKE